MTTTQQSQAKTYFNGNAVAWREKAEGEDTNKVNIIEQRNGFVAQVCDERPSTRSFLDIGCGTGELVCLMAEKGVDAVGIDYAPEMVELGQKMALAQGFERARFVCTSFFDFDLKKESQDVIAANGFIEYISPEELLTLFDRVSEALNPGGSFVVGSRNRLFNLVSMNAFTQQEYDGDGYPLLLEEAIAWSSGHLSAKMKDSSNLLKIASAPLQARDTQHADTGIQVTTRLQYTPLQLIHLLTERGLSAVEVYPVHVHAVSPSFKKEKPDMHAAFSRKLQGVARETASLLVQSSSFMLHVRK